MLLDLTGSFQPVQNRHGDVHEDQIRPNLLTQLDGFHPVGSFTNNLEVLPVLDETSQPLPKEHMVIG
jgi:hypothetical protein